MKEVKFVFSNIQSHEHTEFSLLPGLNFILAEDNNVGKSTIFKAIMYAVKMPRVSLEDSREILRVGCNQGYMSFSFDDVRIILWLFQDEPEKIRAFFEVYHGSNSPMRTTACPKELLEALDIIKGTDGEAVNFNDADSVQLIVQDTPKNDEVLSRVIIDLRVEAIKANSQRLAKEVQLDYRMVKDRYDKTLATLEQLSYNDSVDDFNAESNDLLNLAEATDILVGGCEIGPMETHLKFDGFNQVFELLPVVEGLASIAVKPTVSFLELGVVLELEGILSTMVELSSITSPYNSAIAEFEMDLEQLQCALSLLEDLQTLNVDAIGRIKPKMYRAVQNALVALDILTELNKISYSINDMFQAQESKRRAEREEARILAEMDKLCPKVQCPIKGEVYYSEQECIPTGD